MVFPGQGKWRPMMGALPVGHQAESSLWGALTWERISLKKAFILQAHFSFLKIYTGFCQRGLNESSYKILLHWTSVYFLSNASQVLVLQFNKSSYTCQHVYFKIYCPMHCIVHSSLAWRAISETNLIKVFL